MAFYQSEDAVKTQYYRVQDQTWYLCQNLESTTRIENAGIWPLEQAREWASNCRGSTTVFMGPWEMGEEGQGLAMYGFVSDQKMVEITSTWLRETQQIDETVPSLSITDTKVLRGWTIRGLESLSAGRIFDQKPKIETVTYILF